MPSTTHILILAAGRGTRMGGPKALMQVGGRPWWQVQRERLAAVGLPQTWVVSEAVRTAISGQAGAPERMVVADSDAPMFQSVMAGVESLRGPDRPRGVFVLPVDVPAPGPEVWEMLSRSVVPALPMCRGVHGHPLYSPWRWVESELLGLSPRDRAGLRLDRLIAPSVRHIECGDVSVTINLNTPADVSTWLSGTPPPS